MHREQRGSRALREAAADRSDVQETVSFKPDYFEYLFRGSLPTMCETSWLFSLQMYSISSVSCSWVWRPYSVNGFVKAPASSIVTSYSSVSAFGRRYRSTVCNFSVCG